MRLGGALGRIDDHIYYNDLNEVYDIAALYIEAIAKGHCFADANKRTSLVVGLLVETEASGVDIY
ncbi:type II toxin-antitoxin system death-on-curing family toxin [Vibrio parahaemolyticus]|nr:type II toxin-antitoxin system death-on-curing family toxin [Vibrio parahaemolyticus]